MSLKSFVRTRTIPSGGQAPWMLAGSWERAGTMTTQRIMAMRTSFYRCARFVEVQARLFSKQEDYLPVGDQWSGIIRVRAIRFSTNAVEAIGV